MTGSPITDLSQVLVHIRVTTFNKQGEVADPPHEADLRRCGVQFGTAGDSIPLSDEWFQRTGVGTYRLRKWVRNDPEHDPWDLEFYGITEGECYTVGSIYFEGDHGTITTPGVE